MYQVTNIEHHVYHFLFLLVDVTLWYHTSQLGIEHLTPPTWLEFGVYVNLCYCKVKIYNLACNLLCITLC